MALSNYQLVLLDNLIYLGIFEELNGITTVEKVVHDLLDGNQIHQYWKDELDKDQSDDKNPGQCMMKEDEWREVLRAIANDPVLCSLVISDVVDADSDPDRENTNFRAACFTLMDGEENPQETVIVFRGTHGAYTWNDNGEGATVSDSNSQKEALDYVNRIGAKLTTKGKGNQYSLHQAMLRDETGRLQEMVEEYVAEEDVYNRKKMLPDLIYTWTGVLDEDKFGRGEYLSDARKLEALEVITGRDFTSAYGANPVEVAADFIEDAFDRLIDGKGNDTYIFHPGDGRLENVYIMKAA